ncbi:MAG TPA: hypothetical protein VHA15_11380 [Burkholderiales bacterium]|jgi:hypothetical protein|nr:hypothetical protein [Burkholderiales bacterium]
MRSPTSRRFARREALGLGLREFATLQRLDAPQKVQAFLNGIPANHEFGGETVLSVREVLRQRRAHCIEGAFLAACAFWVHGHPPLVMHLDCDSSDYPHVIALFRQHGHWGAVSKTNGVGLRYRDPIYRSLRELAMSYMHEYSNKRHRKTLRSYSAAFDLRRLDPALWVGNEDQCWEAHDRLAALRHYPLISRHQEKLLSTRDAFEREVTKLVQYPRPKRPPPGTSRTARKK